MSSNQSNMSLVVPIRTDSSMGETCKGEMRIFVAVRGSQNRSVGTQEGGNGAVAYQIIARSIEMGGRTVYATDSPFRILFL